MFSVDALLAAYADDKTRNSPVQIPYLPADDRLTKVHHTYSTFPARYYNSLEEWEARRVELRKRILLSAGLSLEPERPHNPAKIFDVTEYEDFSVAKVMLETYPGFYVTGNLFRPLGKKGPFPAILNPHGHWDRGRCEQSDITNIPTRCANFAKMGFVAMSFDMLGYEDSRQVSHGYGVGAKFERYCANSLGVQIYNSLCCVDFLSDLPDVDADRIGCTGCSGGGTQTFLLTAIDDRIKVAAPINMVSTYMQGGCACENAPLLRVGTYNLDLAALAAPRPLFLAGSTGDWTSLLNEVDYPVIRAIYQLYDKGYLLESFYQTADHNYNQKTRKRIYPFFARHLLGQEMAWEEQPLSFPDEVLRIYRDDEFPTEGLVGSNALFEAVRDTRKQWVKEAWEKDAKAAADRSREALSLMVGVTDAPVVERPAGENAKAILSREATQTTLKFDYRFQNVAGISVRKSFIGTEKDGERIPYVLLQKEGTVPESAVFVCHPEGKWAAVDALLKEHPNCLEEGLAIVAVDPFLTGDFQRPGYRTGRNAPSAHFFTTFEYTDTACRVHDYALALRFTGSLGFSHIEVTGYGTAAVEAAIAMVFAPANAAFTAQLPALSEDDPIWEKELSLPGLGVIGGLETCLKL